MQERKPRVRLASVLALMLALLAVAIPGHVSASDYLVHSNLTALANEASYIVHGTVEETVRVEDSDSPFRARVDYVISTIRVDEVIKGESEGGQIAVGERDAMSTLAQPPGTEVVFFLKEVNHDVASPPPYDYFTVSGPQGRFIVEAGIIAPQGPRSAATTTRYEGMDASEFLEEVRRASERTWSSFLAWGAGIAASLAAVGGLAVAYIRRR